MWNVYRTGFAMPTLWSERNSDALLNETRNIMTCVYGRSDTRSASGSTITILAATVAGRRSEVGNSVVRTSSSPFRLLSTSPYKEAGALDHLPYTSTRSNRSCQTRRRPGYPLRPPPAPRTRRLRLQLRHNTIGRNSRRCQWNADRRRHRHRRRPDRRQHRRRHRRQQMQRNARRRTRTKPCRLTTINRATRIPTTRRRGMNTTPSTNPPFNPAVRRASIVCQRAIATKQSSHGYERGINAMTSTWASGPQLESRR
jgi:hypothetical protein